MNRQGIVSTIGLLVVLAVLLFWLTRSPRVGERAVAQSEESKAPGATSVPAAADVSNSPTPSAEAERRNQALEQVTDAFNTPIAFYGRVIDQNGNPVTDADVGYTAADKFNASGSHYTGKSDTEGLFQISGIKGGGLLVGVGKHGYYPVNGKSSGSFAYGMGADSYRQAAPTKDNPAIFLLHKGGATEPLIQVSSRQIDVPRTGQTMSIDLATGQTGQGSLQVASWIGDSKQRRFDWRYLLSVAGGGLVERKEQFDFQAPVDGYQPAIEVNMAATAEQWTSRLTRQYFARLADGRHARFSIRFYAGSRNFVVLESYLNPNPGSRNLEFDPNKVAQP